jgi:hypothetical protein
LENKVGTIAQQASAYTNIVDEIKSGDVAGRLAKVEGHIGGMMQQANLNGLKSLLSRVQGLQVSDIGTTQLQDITTAFLGVGQGASDDAELAARYAALKQNNPQVGAVFEGVAPEDMQAAVMLMGMAQLRQSLARDNASFDQDLQILKTTLARDNPELQAAIDKLAPQAKKGVLTPAGLSQELRGLTGEIVTASLTGQDISIQEKAMARLNDVVKVEKNGSQISGTTTQIKIAEAQKKLDAGDVQGAVALLQEIQGPAADKTKPVIDAAQATLLASQLRDMMGQNLGARLKSLTQKSGTYAVGGGGLTGLTSELDTIIHQVKSIGMGAVTGQ